MRRRRRTRKQVALDISEHRKTCNECGVRKDLTLFNNRANNSDGHSCLCRKCQQAYDRDRNTHSGSEIKRRARSNALMRKYGITLDEFERMKEQHKNRCGICGKPSNDPRRAHDQLHIDHDHSTGVVRGLLCGKCNKGLGMFDDKEGLLRNAIEYLKENKEK